MVTTFMKTLAMKIDSFNEDSSSSYGEYSNEDTSYSD